MRNWSAGLSAVVIVALVATSAHAISSGPGGRIYTTSRFDNGTKYVALSSILIGANWDNAGLVGVSQTRHGKIYDNYDHGDHQNWGISPEIETPGQAPGYANLVMGLAYNNSPASTISGGQTMDVVRITPDHQRAKRTI